jgi:hypothetical protein
MSSSNGLARTIGRHRDLRGLANSETGLRPPPATGPATVLIATRARADQKARFRALAASRGLDESKLLTLLIDRVLEKNPPPLEETQPSTARVSGARITIRLRAGDVARLAQRSGARGLKPSSYLAALARAHLRGDPPLPMSELAAVKRAVAELGAIGRHLNQIARVAHQDGVVGAELPAHLDAVASQLEPLRKSIADLVQANLVSWESDGA